MERQEAALLSEKRRLDNGETLAVPPATDVLSAAQPIAMWALSACLAPSAPHFSVELPRTRKAKLPAGLPQL
jgi:hypothetical protein